MSNFRTFNGKRFKLVSTFKKRSRLLPAKREIQAKGKKVRVVKLRGKLVNNKWMLYTED